MFEIGEKMIQSLMTELLQRDWQRPLSVTPLLPMQTSGDLLTQIPSQRSGAPKSATWTMTSPEPRDSLQDKAAGTAHTTALGAHTPRNRGGWGRSALTSIAARSRLSPHSDRVGLGGFACARLQVVLWSGTLFPLRSDRRRDNIGPCFGLQTVGKQPG